MSLILEALKKLEREKQAPDRGFLVVAHTAWPARRGAVSNGMALALGLVALASAGLAAYVLLAPRAGPPPASTTPPTPAPVPTAPAALPLAAAPAPVKTLALPVPPDPARRPAEAAEAPAAETAELRLGAISEQDGVPVAILNDRLVREGDRFGDVTVLRIGSTEVEVEVRGQRKVVRF
jgi:hypothetical protein